MDTIELKKESTLSVEQQFATFEAQAQEWSEKANLIIVEDLSQTDLMQQARDARLVVRNIRLNVEKKHKDLKADALRFTTTLDTVKRRLVGLLEPIEEHLLTQEKFAEVQEEKRKSKLKEERSTILKPFLGAQADFLQLGEMDEDVFQNMLRGYQLAQEERTRKEQEERAKIEQQKKKDEDLRAQLQTDNKRLKEEQFKKDQELALLQANKRKLEKEANDLKLKQEAEAKHKLSEERKAKRLPDNKKLLAFAEQILNLPMPDVKDEEAQKIASQAKILLAKTARFIGDKVSEL